MKILFIENQFKEIKYTIELLSILHFNNNLNYDVIYKSQDIDYQSIHEYELIFVDIHLTAASINDGFEIINELILNHYPANKIAVLSGLTNVKNIMAEKGINVIIIRKPPMIEDLIAFFKTNQLIA